MHEHLYRIALCGLADRDERVAGVVLTRVASPRFRYEWVTLDSPCDIVLVDPANPVSNAHLSQLRTRNPHVVTLALTDGPIQPGARHVVSRRTLWSSLIATLDELAGRELSRPRTRSTETSAIVTPVAGSRTAAATTPDHSQARIRALILDDSITVRTQIEAALRKNGISTDCAADWPAAAALLERNRYDVLFLDIVMPDIDGYEVCKRIRRNPATRNLPVLMLTSRSSAFDRARGALAGCDMYLIKPIELAAFHAAVNRVVARICRNDLAQARQRGFVPAVAWPGG